MNKQQGRLFIFSGPSGVGKTTIVTKFLQLYQQQYNMSRVVTYTTKNPRLTECHGVDYHFITASDFENKIKQDFFLEWSGEYGAWYGTPSSVMQELSLGFSKILVIDRVGAAQILSKYPQAILIWVKVSSMELLLNRLQSRQTESFEQVQSRFFLAQKEIEEEKNQAMYHYHVENNDLNRAIEQICDIVTRSCS